MQAADMQAPRIFALSSVRLPKTYFCRSLAGKIHEPKYIRRQNVSSRSFRRQSNQPCLCKSSKQYGPQNATDTTLAWGDILTLVATEVSSSRIPWDQWGMLCGVLVLCWVGTAIATGDYRYKSASNQMLFNEPQFNMILAAVNCSVTWIVFVPVALACYASLVSHSWMPKTVFLPSAQPGELPAQLEVLVATLFTISSWRGIYAGFRTYI